MVASGRVVFVCSSDKAVDGLERYGEAIHVLRFVDWSVLVESLHHPKVISFKWDGLLLSLPMFISWFDLTFPAPLINYLHFCALAVCRVFFKNAAKIGIGILGETRKKKQWSWSLPLFRKRASEPTVDIVCRCLIIGIGYGMYSCNM